MNFADQIRTESEGFQRFLSDLDKWQRQRWFTGKMFLKLERRLSEKRRKKYGRQ